MYIMYMYVLLPLVRYYRIKSNENLLYSASNNVHCLKASLRKERKFRLYKTLKYLDFLKMFLMSKPVATVARENSFTP